MGKRAAAWSLVYCFCATSRPPVRWSCPPLGRTAPRRSRPKVRARTSGLITQPHHRRAYRSGTVRCPMLGCAHRFPRSDEGMIREVGEAWIKWMDFSRFFMNAPSPSRASPSPPLPRSGGADGSQAGRPSSPLTKWGRGVEGEARDGEGVFRTTRMRPSRLGFASHLRMRGVDPAPPPACRHPTRASHGSRSSFGPRRRGEASSGDLAPSSCSGCLRRSFARKAKSLAFRPLRGPLLTPSIHA